MRIHLIQLMSRAVLFLYGDSVTDVLISDFTKLVSVKVAGLIETTKAEGPIRHFCWIHLKLKQRTAEH